MFTEQDYDVIKNRMLDNLDYDIDKREGSFINDMYSPMAIEFAKTYIEMDNVHSIMFVDSAFGEDLDKKVYEFGIPRKLGERARGTIKFKGTDKTLIPRNMTISTDGGYKYITISQGYIVDGEVDILVEAQEVGEIYNIESNAKWELPNEVVVDELVNEADFEGGINIEEDEELRKRFFDTVQNVRTSGNKNDYEYWAKEVVGVYNADVYPLHSGPGTVKVVASGEGRLPLSSEILENCRDFILDSAPIGATVTVITTSLFNVTINLALTVDEEYNEEDVKVEVEKAIRNYIGTCVDKIYYNKLGANILSCNGVIDYTTLNINGSTSSIISIPADNVANIKAINITSSVGVYNE